MDVRCGYFSGSRWSLEIASSLHTPNAGIICLTRENIQAPWILFEAGALSKALKNSLVCTYLLGINARDVTDPFWLQTGGWKPAHGSDIEALSTETESKQTRPNLRGIGASLDPTGILYTAPSGASCGGTLISRDQKRPTIFKSRAQQTAQDLRNSFD